MLFIFRGHRVILTRRFFASKEELNQLKIKLQRYKKFKDHESITRSIIFGSLLGDANIEHRSNNSRIRFRMSTKHVEYMQFLKNHFMNHGYCNDKIFQVKTNLNKKTQKDFGAIHFETWSMKSFNELHSLVYRKPTTEEALNYLNKMNKNCQYIKIIPETISEYLDEIAFAHWIMGDGSFEKGNGRLRIATNSYTRKEQLLLQKVLRVKFNLNCNIYSSGQVSVVTQEKLFILSFPKTEVFKIILLVKPFFVPSMFYKLGLDESG